MKILLIAPQVPWPPRQGTALRNYNVARQLARRHEVTVLAFGRPAPDDPLMEAGVRVISVPAPPPRSTARRLLDLATRSTPDLARRLGSRAMDLALAEEISVQRSRGGPDVIQVEGLEMAPYALEARRQIQQTDHRLVYDAHNAEWLLQARAWRADMGLPRRWHAAAYSLVQTLKLRRFERRLLSRCDAAVAVSRADADCLRRLQPGIPLEVVPNGVDTDHYAPADPAAGEPGLCVFTGKMDFRPNIDAMVWFVGTVWPIVRRRRSDARLLIVGRDPVARVAALTGDGVALTGAVDDVRDYLTRAAVVVAPLRVGGGTRLKVLEAMAMERAVAATRLAVEGLDLAPGVEVLLGDTPEELAGHVLDLLTDPVRRAEVAARARARVVADYRWESLVPRIERLYRAGPVERPAV